MNSISFVILHYNDIETTEQCVQSILSLDYQELIQIVIVDNDVEKSFKDRQVLKQKYCTKENIHVLKVMEKHGFSYANNYGYAYSRDTLGAEFILILNNDVIFTQKNFVALMKNSFERHKCHILAPDIIRAGNHEHQNPLDIRIRTREEAKYTILMNRISLKLYPFLYPILYVQSKWTEKRKYEQKKEDEAYYMTEHKNIVPFGAGIIFTPIFVRQEEKAFSPETRFYYEEYILALNCQRKGYQVVYDPSMCLLHESGKATRKSMGNEWRRIRFMMEQTLESCKVYLKFLDE